MVFKRTLSVQVNKICHGKSREDIVAEFKSAYPQHSLVAVQVGFDTVRVTFENVEIFKEAHAHTHVPIFGQRWPFVWSFGLGVGLVFSLSDAARSQSVRLGVENSPWSALYG